MLENVLERLIFSGFSWLLNKVFQILTRLKLNGIRPLTPLRAQQVWMYMSSNYRAMEICLSVMHTVLRPCIWGLSKHTVTCGIYTVFSLFAMLLLLQVTPGRVSTALHHSFMTHSILTDTLIVYWQCLSVSRTFLFTDFTLFTWKFLKNKCLYNF